MATPHTFTRGQRVEVRRLIGPTFTPDWSERATISGKPYAVSATSGEWYPVRFADGGKLAIHETQLAPITRKRQLADLVARSPTGAGWLTQARLAGKHP